MQELNNLPIVSIKVGNYLFRVCDSPNKLFVIKDNTVQFSDFYSVNVFQNAENNNFNGVREIIIEQLEERPIVDNEPEVFNVDKKRFLDFINANDDLRTSFINVINPEL